MTFDGTIVEHRYPDIGAPVPGAIRCMKELQEAGHKLILLTMRSGETLAEAVEYCRRNGVEFYAVNDNPSQISWTSSRKIYANLYVDDAAIGCPLRESARLGGRPYVDWEKVSPMIWEAIGR